MKNKSGNKTRVNPRIKARNLFALLSTVSLLSSVGQSAFASYPIEQNINKSPVLIAQNDSYDDYGNYDDSYNENYDSESSAVAGESPSRGTKGVSLFTVVATNIAGFLLLAFFICFIASFSALCACFVWNVTKLFNGGKKPKVG